MRRLAFHSSAAFFAIAATAPVFAENPPVVDAWLSNLETQFAQKPVAGAVETAADGTIHIKGMTITKAAEGDKPGMTVKVDDVSLENVSDKGNGLFEIGKSAVTGIHTEFADDKGTKVSIDVPEAAFETLYVRAAKPNATAVEQLLQGSLLARKASAGKMTADINGTQVAASGISLTWDGDPLTGAGDMGFALDDLSIPPQAIAMMDPGGKLQSLGYTGLSFGFDGNGKTTVENETYGYAMTINYNAKNMGKLSMGIDAKGIPAQAMVELREAGKAGRPPEFTAMMPQLMGVTFNSVKLRFEDASITKKMMPLIAAAQGMDEATLIANAGAMAQIGLSQLKSPDFAAQTVGAINSFLKDPRSFTVSLKPSAPVTVQQLMTLNPADPGAAIAQLGVSVSAND
jgi:hypothetical protein